MWGGSEGRGEREQWGTRCTPSQEKKGVCRIVPLASHSQGLRAWCYQRDQETRRALWFRWGRNRGQGLSPERRQAAAGGRRLWRRTKIRCFSSHNPGNKPSNHKSYKGINACHFPLRASGGQGGRTIRRTIEASHFTIAQVQAQSAASHRTFVVICARREAHAPTTCSFAVLWGLAVFMNTQCVSSFHGEKDAGCPSKMRSPPLMSSSMVNTKTQIARGETDRSDRGSTDSG